jgi:acetyl esterase/lipase
MTNRLAVLAALLCVSAIPASRAQQLTMPLWPHATPEPVQSDKPETDSGVPTSTLAQNYHYKSLSDVTIPTLSYFPAKNNTTGAAALVFPGGGYQHLAWTKEGLDTCDWLNAIGVTCLLVKYRVPEEHYPASHADLEDAQQAMRIAKQHADEWHINPARIGVVGFSAGGNLGALLSLHADDDHIASTPAAADANTTIDAKPAFAIFVYPAYLAINPEQVALDPVYTPNATTPPTFLTAAENDKTYGRNAIVYYRALMDAGVPAELHYFPTGGHGFGVHPVGAPGEWTALATRWLRLQGFAAAPETKHGSANFTPAPMPCPMTPTAPPAPATPNQQVNHQTNQQPDPNCPPMTPNQNP